jgi:hypothetical protein
MVSPPEIEIDQWLTQSATCDEQLVAMQVEQAVELGVAQGGTPPSAE